MVIESITLVDSGVWVFTWTPESTASYRVVLNGKLLANVQTESYTYRGHLLDYPPPLEITTADQLAESEINSGNVTIQWYGDSSAKGYYVQEFIDGDWETIKDVRETGEYIYTFSIDNLADETTHTFQVIAYNDFEDESTGADLIFFIVRPVVLQEADYSVTYNGTDIVIAEV